MMARFVRQVAALMSRLRRALSPKEDRLPAELHELVHATFALATVHEATTEPPTAIDGDEHDPEGDA